MPHSIKPINWALDLDSRWYTKQNAKLPNKTYCCREGKGFFRVYIVATVLAVTWEDNSTSRALSLHMWKWLNIPSMAPQNLWKSRRKAKIQPRTENAWGHKAFGRAQDISIGKSLGSTIHKSRVRTLLLASFFWCRLLASPHSKLLACVWITTVEKMNRGSNQCIRVRSLRGCFSTPLYIGLLLDTCYICTWMYTYWGQHPSVSYCTIGFGVGGCLMYLIQWYMEHLDFQS